MNLSDATIGQLMIPVDDLDRGVNFYRDTLGLQFLFTAPPQMAFFMCGGIRLLIGVPTVGQTAQRGSAVYFKVNDIQKVASTLRQKGVHFLTQPHSVHRSPSSELWLAEFLDPDGNHLALMNEIPL